MKPAAIQRLRRSLADGLPTYGLWVTLESPSITEMAVAVGLDWVVIDAEHGHLDWQEIVGHLRSTARSTTVCMVRLAELNAGLVKRALDLGADGVVIPQVQSAEDVRRAVSFARYPPGGVRGIGAERATAWGRLIPEHVALANDQVLVVPLIENRDALAAIGEIVAVAGVEFLLIGPADLSASFGAAGQWEGPGVPEAILTILNTARVAGKQCGILGTSADDLNRRRDQGFRLLGLGADASLLFRALSSLLAQAGRTMPPLGEDR